MMMKRSSLYQEQDFEERLVMRDIDDCIFKTITQGGANTFLLSFLVFSLLVKCWISWE